MAKPNYTDLIASLKTRTREFSSNDCARNNSKASREIANSNLSEEEKTELQVVLSKCSDTCYGHWNDSGVSGLIAHLEAESKPTPKVDRKNLLELFANQIVNVKFEKRTTGEVRSMNCRIGVTKHLKGGKAAYSAAQKGLLTVFDMTKKSYRSIPLEGIQSVTTGSQTHTFV